MNQSGSETKQQITIKDIILKMRWVLTVLGVLAVFQFIVLGLYGIYFGYSIQTQLSVNIMQFGVFLTILAPYYKKFFTWFIITTVGFAVFNGYVSDTIRLHSIETGKALYEQGQYEKALKFFEKASETKSWYLRFIYISKPEEASALEWIGNTYSRLGNFRKARDYYELSLQQFPTATIFDNIKNLQKTLNEQPDT